MNNNNNNICYRVVTGVRFKKVNQIIHIQIQQGELMPRGNIDKASVHWKSIEEFNVLDNNVKNGVDYHTLSWEKRGLDLDDLVLDKNYLLTGTFQLKIYRSCNFIFLLIILQVLSFE